MTQFLIKIYIFKTYFKGTQSELVHMRITYRSIANLHVTETSRNTVFNQT